MSEDTQAKTVDDNEILKEKLLHLMPESGKYTSKIEGLRMVRRHISNVQENCCYTPSVAVIVQGFKRAVVGSKSCDYGENQTLVVGVDLPTAFYVSGASPEHPFLAVSLDLDRYIITQLSAEIPPALGMSDVPGRGISVAGVDPGVRDAFIRMLELLNKPEQIPVLAPLISREIHYRLLTGPQGNFLRALNTLGSQSNQISQAVSWLKENYAKPLQVDLLARQVNMATSTFHRHFRAVTTLSPLQFQKRLRLYEAQRLMMMDKEDASSAGLAVGYESPTQFNREYKRLFGEPPHRNIKRLEGI